MQTIIRTEYVNLTGAGKIRAKGAGKQRTLPVDLSKSNEWNHGTVAGELALVLGLPWSPAIEHDSNDSGTKHGFAWPE